MHYLKLAVRSGFFLAALILYLTGNLEKTVARGVFPAIVWIWYFAEMALRFIPWKMESMGCEKVFSKNYKDTQRGVEPKNQSWRATFTVAAVWLALNGAIFALYLSGVIDKWLLAIVALAYGVCDIVCILFFCPFQTWFMKNRCCTTCRIYNWDFAMLFTPFLLIPSLYTYTLLGFALVILLRWEITYKLHPERFSERTNESLRCQNCTEKLCRHKVQLKHYISRHRDILFEKLEPVVERLDREAAPIAEKYEEIEEGLIDTARIAITAAKDTYERAKDKTVEVVEKTKEATEKIVDKTKEAVEKTRDFTKEATEKIVDKTKEAVEKTRDFTKEATEKIVDKTKETAEKIADKTKATFGKSTEKTAAKKSQAEQSPTDKSTTEQPPEQSTASSAHEKNNSSSATKLPPEQENSVAVPNGTTLENPTADEPHTIAPEAASAEVISDKSPVGK